MKWEKSKGTVGQVWWFGHMGNIVKTDGKKYEWQVRVDVTLVDSFVLSSAVGGECRTLLEAKEEAAHAYACIRQPASLAVAALNKRRNKMKRELRYAELCE